MSDPSQFIRCMSEGFTEVRELESGRLLGCIPVVPESADTVFDVNGKAFPLMLAMRPSVAVKRGSNPDSLDGFVAVDASIDLAIPAPGTDGDPLPGEDPDIGAGV